jgi:hypothetical protein
MYRLYYGSEFLFDPYTDNIVYDAKLTAKTNTSDYLDFTVPYGHDLYDSLAVKAETVKLYWDKDCLYVGTIESIETDIQGNLDVTCTGALDWLADSIVRPYSTVEGEQPLTAPTSVDGLFEWYIDQHNEHCLDTRKQFSVGENQGALLDENNYVYRASGQMPDTLSEVKSKIISDLGGYLFVNYEPLTIDLYADVHTTNAQIIDFGVNITDFTSTTDTSEQYTAIRPEGATPESEEGSEETQRPITIEALADGGVDGYSDLWKVGDVVYSVSGVARYGYREYAYSNTDCTTEQDLLTSACKKLNAILSPDLSITVKAVDLSLFMDGYTHLKVGEAVRVRSKFHGIDEYLMVQSIELDLQDPSQSTYELGAEYSTLTGQQSTYLKNLNSNINSALDATSALSDETKAAASEAKDAKTQAAEAKAAADAAVVSNVAQWAVTADPATKPAEDDWSEEAPDYEAGKYIWLRNVITYGSGETSATDGVCITGNTGKGVKGDNAYVHIAYANSEDGKTDFSVDDPVGKSYIGQYSDNLEDDSTDPTKYSWTKIKGEHGVSPTVTTEQTDTGATITITDATGTKTATVTNGDAGKGVASIVEQYYQSTSATSQTGGSWSGTYPGWVDGKYIWTRSVITYTDATTTTTTPVCVTGSKGGSGDQGTSITDVDVWYYQSTSATALSGGSWSTTAPTWANGKYIWTKTITTYSTGKTSESEAACITGQQGATGKGVKSVVVTYQAGTSGTTVPTGTWSSSVPTVTKGQYLWTKTVTTYTDSATSIGYSVSYQPTNGTNGTSVTISSTSVTYQASTSGTTTPTGTWSTSVPTVSNGSYLWTKTVVTYSTGTSTTSYSVAYKGTDGAGFQWNLLNDSRFTASSHHWVGEDAAVQYENVYLPPSAEVSGDKMMRVTSSAGGRVYYNTSLFKHTVGNTYTCALWYYVSTNQTKDCTLAITIGKGRQIVKSVDLPAKDCTWRRVTATYTAQFSYGLSLVVSAGTQVCIWHPYLANGTTSAEWCTTQAETIGAKGESVTKVAVTYGLSTSNASDGYSSVTSWTTNIPDWVSGKYIWQKSVTTIGTTAQSPVYALYGAFNSLASTVDGHTTLIKQQGDSIALKANSTDVANDIATAKSAAITTAASDATTKADNALASAKTYADSQIKVSADNITSTVASTYETLTDAATIKTTAETAASDASTALSTANVASSKITQTASRVGIAFNDSGTATTGTLINADSTGIEVGYSEDGSSFASTHTKMGTDAFSIHDASHNELASFGTTAVVGQTTGGNVQITSSAVNIRSKTTNMASITSSSAVIGSTSGTNRNVLVNGTQLAFRQGTTTKATIKNVTGATTKTDNMFIYGDNNLMLAAGTSSKPMPVYLTVPPDANGDESDTGLGLTFTSNTVATSKITAIASDWDINIGGYQRFKGTLLWSGVCAKGGTFTCAAMRQYTLLVLMIGYNPGTGLLGIGLIAPQTVGVDCIEFHGVASFDSGTDSYTARCSLLMSKDTSNNSITMRAASSHKVDGSDGTAYSLCKVYGLF